MHFRLIRWDIDALKRGAAAVKIYGLFHDAKEVHYVFSNARRANTAREAYETNALQCEGFSPAAVPEELKTLRVECGRGPGHETYSLLQVVKHGEDHYVVVPDEAALRVVVDEPLRKRLAELRAKYPGAPPAKRARVGAAGTSPDTAQPKYASVLKLLEKFTIKQRAVLMVDQVEYALLWVELKADAKLQLHYLHNHSSERRTFKGLPVHS